jgi:hypothetical protein
MPRGLWRPPDRATRVHGPAAAFEFYKRTTPSPRLCPSPPPLLPPNLLATAALIVRRLAPSAPSALHGPAQRISLLGLAAAENPQWHMNDSQSHNVHLRPFHRALRDGNEPFEHRRLVFGPVKMRDRAELRSARPASLAPFLVAGHI